MRDEVDISVVLLRLAGPAASVLPLVLVNVILTGVLSVSRDSGTCQRDSLTGVLSVSRGICAGTCLDSNMSTGRSIQGTAQHGICIELNN